MITFCIKMHWPVKSQWGSCHFASSIIWVASWQNQQNGMCAQRRLRSAWATAQFDQSSLSAWRSIGSSATHWAHSEDSDQTGRMPRLIWVFVGRTCHFVRFVMYSKVNMTPMLHQCVRENESVDKIGLDLSQTEVDCHANRQQEKWHH